MKAILIVAALAVALFTPAEGSDKCTCDFSMGDYLTSECYGTRDNLCEPFLYPNCKCMTSSDDSYNTQCSKQCDLTNHTLSSGCYGYKWNLCKRSDDCFCNYDFNDLDNALAAWVIVVIVICCLIPVCIIGCIVACCCCAANQAAQPQTTVVYQQQQGIPQPGYVQAGQQPAYGTPGATQAYPQPQQGYQQGMNTTVY